MEQEKNLQTGTDELTGFCDRASAQTLVDSVLSEQTGTVILLDIVDFHKLNARFGYNAGDHFLRDFAQIIRHMVLPSDIIGRIGGDEFYLFLRGDHDEAFLQERVRQIRKRISSEKFESLPGENVRCSAGYALYESGDTFRTMLGRAESMLMSDKSAIRERMQFVRKSISADIRQIRRELGQQTEPKGAFCQNSDGFEILYAYMMRMMKRIGKHAFLLLITLTDADGSLPDYEKREELMTVLGDVIRESLRITDVFTRYSVSQYIIMNADSDTVYAAQIADRVRKTFYERVGGSDKTLLLHEAYPMDDVGK